MSKAKRPMHGLFIEALLKYPGTQEALAAKTGVSQTQISHFRRNVREPSLRTFERLCSKLGLKLVKAE